MAYREQQLEQQLLRGSTLHMRDTMAPMDDTKPYSYMISCSQVPPGIQYEQERRYYVQERDRKGDIRNIRVLKPSEAREWLRCRGTSNWECSEFPPERRQRDGSIPVPMEY